MCDTELVRSSLTKIQTALDDRSLGQPIFPMLFRQVLNESVFLIVCHTLTVFYRSSKEGFPAQLLPLLFD